VLSKLKRNNIFKESENNNDTSLVEIETSLLNLKNSLLEKVFDELDSFTESIFEDQEMRNLKLQLSSLKNPKEFVVWVVAYLKEKIHSLHGTNKALMSEKSN
jgi:hypothetical protein